jgi:3-hydroxyisobutyrate dehydrogenase-like beta-hydroxyacid dehydrogenase
LKISVIGLGLMGKAIAARLQAANFSVTGWNRSAHRLPAPASGLRASTAPEITAAADTLLLTLSDAAAIDETLFSTPGVSTNAKMVVQTGTISPAESRGLGDRIADAGGRYLEAPVLGSLPEAAAGRLIIMAGGSEKDFEYCRPVLEALGPEPRLIGGTGQGAALKLAMNHLIAGLTAAFSASLGLVRAEGIDPGIFMALLRESALYAPTFDKKLPKMLAHEYANPNFPLVHLLKDARLFADTAGGHQIDVRVARALTDLFADGVTAGHGAEDYSVLYETLNPGKA